ncbi:hypothetical protein E5672_18860 [Alteromonas portus]|uniref:Lyase n=1 Tax=Alteromonas portus TaxID=2565549 RepID=A0A4U0Z512_9ALTE|nr:hypothetical protein [Alteromonas portus]TKB00729.1 hypothetical protein E5672_18860 [Alteromonas portus]
MDCKINHTKNVSCFYSHKNLLLAALIITYTNLVSFSSYAAEISGRVMTEGQQVIAGAIVSLWNEERTQKLSTYTDHTGYFKLQTDFVGKTTLRGRSPYYRDNNLPLELNENTVAEQLIILEKMESAQEVSDSLPASAHVTKLKLDDEETRGAVISQCNYCHQLGNSITRVPRNKDAWSMSIKRMEGYGAFITEEEHHKIKDLLFDGFDGSPVEVIQTLDYSPELAQATIHEWLVATPMSFLHDTIVGENGNLYGIDEGSDTIYELDRVTDKVTLHKIPGTEDLPEGGNFEGAQLPIGIFTGHHGPHSGVQIDDGRMFFTAALSSVLISFHPDTKQWQLYPIPRGFLWRKGIYSHTIRKDKNNDVWFTVLGSNMVLKFDTDEEEFTEIKLPSNGFLKWMTDMFMGTVLKIASNWPKENYQIALSHHKTLDGGRQIFNWPYGIDIHPTDGGVWYAKLLDNKIGHIDPETLEITEYETPYKGPRRMRFDKDGILWIPSFDEGVLMRFDPSTKQFENIQLPLLSKNEYEVPYALNVHEHTGDIWIAANNSDRVLRYIPKEERFISYPMPSRVVWFRDFEFTKDGQVCTSNSNLPAYAHEDGLPAFFCINPEGRAIAKPEKFEQISKNVGE